MVRKCEKREGDRIAGEYHHIFSCSRPNGSSGMFFVPYVVNRLGQEFER